MAGIVSSPGSALRSTAHTGRLKMVLFTSCAWMVHRLSIPVPMVPNSMAEAVNRTLAGLMSMVHSPVLPMEFSTTSSAEPLISSALTAGHTSSFADSSPTMAFSGHSYSTAKSVSNPSSVRKLTAHSNVKEVEKYITSVRVVFPKSITALRERYLMGEAVDRSLKDREGRDPDPRIIEC